MNTSKNHLAIVLIIYGFTLPGLEIISNALKAYGEGHMSFLSFFLTVIAGSIYTLTSLPLITSPTFLKSARLLKLLPLIVAFLTLFLVKFVSTNAMLANFNNPTAWCLFLAEIVPGFGKRLILILALLLPSTSIGQTVDPFYELEKPKTKKE